MKWTLLSLKYILRPTGIHCILRRQTIISILSALMVMAAATVPYGTAFAQNTVKTEETESQKAVSTKSSVQSSALISFKASNNRDPFLNPLLKKKDENGDREIDRGLPPPGIAGTFIAEAVLKGISIRENGKLAIVKGNGNRAYFLREGDKLFDGYLKTIHSDSITLVRVTNMRSGKVLTQEVTKKLRAQ